MLDSEILVPPEPPLSEVKRWAKYNVRVHIDGKIALLTQKYPTAEVQSWEMKRVAARRYLAGKADAAEKELLETEAGGNATNLAKAILAKAQWWAAVLGTAAQIRQDAYTTIDAAKTKEEVQQALEAAHVAAEQAWREIIDKAL